MATERTNSGDRNPDPITGAPGSHPVGTGVGSAAGAATGAAIGAVGGPVGAIIGGVAGAIVGGGAGHAAGEWNDPTEDETYWRKAYTDRPYVKQGEAYDDYADAYRYGGTAARTHAVGSTTAGGGTGVLERTKDAVANAGAKVKDALTPDTTSSTTTTGSYTPAARFEDREATIRADYEKSAAASRLPYDRARHAIKDAYDRAIQLREERLNVGKERVSTGEATIRKEVTTEHRTVDIPLQREELVIERRPASGAAAGGTIGESETIRVPLSEERAKVSKDTVVTEEVSIGKKATTHTEHVGADVRKETLKVDETVRDQTKR